MIDVPHVVEKIKYTFYTFNTLFSETSAFYVIMWKNMVQPGRPQMTI